MVTTSWVILSPNTWEPIALHCLQLFVQTPDSPREDNNAWDRQSHRTQVPVSMKQHPRQRLRRHQVVGAAITGQQDTFNPKQNTCKRAVCWTGWDTRRDSGRSQDSKRHSRSDENKTRKRAPSEKCCFNNEPRLETIKERGWKIRPHENSRCVYS